MTIRAIIALPFLLLATSCGGASNDSPATLVGGAPTDVSAPTIFRDRFDVTESTLSFEATLNRLLVSLDRRDLTIFAVIDHAAGAKSAGLSLPPSTLVIFGNPNAGTPLINTDPILGAELPLRALVYQQGETVHLGMTNIGHLDRYYQLTNRAAIIDNVDKTLKAIAAEATNL